MTTIEKIKISEIVHRAVRKTKTSFDYCLANIGLKKLESLKVGLNDVYNDDVFLVSYPKSGNTWLRFIIANLLNPEQEITFRNIEACVADIYKSKKYIDELQPRPRFIKTHDTEYEYYPKIVYIYRDGRDVAVSFYYYLLGRGEFVGTFSDFLKFNPGWGAAGWSNHVSKALVHGAKHPESIFFIKYEDMLQSQFDIVLNLAKFCNLPNDTKLINKAINDCKLSSLKSIENKYGGEDKRYQNKFFRQGTSGQWQSIFSKEDLVEYMAIAGQTLSDLGYID